eukprot:369280-Rhodomonas_salina.2
MGLRRTFEHGFLGRYIRHTRDIPKRPGAQQGILVEHTSTERILVCSTSLGSRVPGYPGIIQQFFSHALLPTTTLGTPVPGIIELLCRGSGGYYYLLGLLLPVVIPVSGSKSDWSSEHQYTSKFFVGYPPTGYRYDVLAPRRLEWGMGIPTRVPGYPVPGYARNS